MKEIFYFINKKYRKMAKGIKNKHGKRLRSAKAAHFYEVKGKALLNRLNAKLCDPNYKNQDIILPTNAFLEPDNPLAVFP